MSCDQESMYKERMLRLEQMQMSLQTQTNFEGGRQSQTLETEKLMHAAMLLHEAILKCDEIVRWQQLATLRQIQEDEAMTIERLHDRTVRQRVKKEVHNT